MMEELYRIVEQIARLRQQVEDLGATTIAEHLTQAEREFKALNGLVSIAEHDAA